MFEGSLLCESSSVAYAVDIDAGAQPRHNAATFDPNVFYHDDELRKTALP